MKGYLLIYDNGDPSCVAEEDKTIDTDLLIAL